MPCSSGRSMGSKVKVHVLPSTFCSARTVTHCPCQGSSRPIQPRRAPGSLSGAGVGQVFCQYWICDFYGRSIRETARSTWRISRGSAHSRPQCHVPDSGSCAGRRIPSGIRGEGVNDQVMALCACPPAGFGKLRQVYRGIDLDVNLIRCMFEIVHWYKIPLISCYTMFMPQLSGLVNISMVFENQGVYPGSPQHPVIGNSFRLLS